MSGKMRTVVIIAIAAAMLSTVLVPLQAEASPDTWTIMVYLDADNDLEQYALNNFMQMSEVQNSAYVHIVVQLDRVSGYDSSYGDWTDCMRFNVTQGTTPSSVPGKDLGEVNMGDPGTLVDFVDWTHVCYPSSDHYVLILWDHGGDWMGVCEDNTSGNDRLTIAELDSALATIKSDIGGPLDILGFDACAMGSVEVAYQFSQYTDYFVASEGGTPLLGFSYDRPLWALTNQTTMTSLQFCDQMISGYHDYYSSMINKPYQLDFAQSLTLSATDSDSMGNLASAVNSLVTELRSNLKCWVNNIRVARNATETYVGPTSLNTSVVDIYHFASNLRATSSNVTMRALCSNVMSAINSSIKDEMHLNDPFDFSRPVDNAHGLSVYFPRNMTSDLSNYLSGLFPSFATKTNWSALLLQYYVEVAKGNPTVLRSSPVGANVSLGADINFTFSEPMDQATLAASFAISPNLAGSLQWGAATNELTFTPSSPLAPSTNYTISIRWGAKDEEGKYLQCNYTCNFTTRAVVSGYSTLAVLYGELGDGGWYISSVNATFSTNDPEATSWTRYSIDNGSWRDCAGNTTICSEDGNHTLEYRSQDLAGNNESVNRLNFGIDRAAPSTSSSVSGSRVRISSNDSVSGVAHTYYRIDGGAWFNYTWEFDVTGSGNHTVEFYSVDNAGNIEVLQTTWVDNGANAFEIISTYGLYIVIGIIVVIVIIAVINSMSKRKEEP